MPGMPMPAAIAAAHDSVGMWPSDANCFERTRDRILWLFALKSARRLFIALSLLVCVLVVVAGLIITWAVLGLFLGVDNGWNEFSDECIEFARRYNHSLTPMYIPKPPGASWGWSRDAHIAGYCTANQFWFNVTIKAFVILFSYINFLPIPWRLAILHHVYCSKRGCRVGVDFYNRPTAALWFNIPVGRRKAIAVLLNLAYVVRLCARAAEPGLPVLCRTPPPPPSPLSPSRRFSAGID